MIIARRARLIAALFAAAVFSGGVSCASTRQLLALRQVEFNIDRAERILLAGVLVDNVRRFSDLSLLDAGRLTTAAVRGQMPLEFMLHVVGNNPVENNTTARLVRMQWTLLLNGTETVSGSIDTVYTFAPGQPTDMGLMIRLDLVRFFRNNAQDLFELALGLAGTAARQTTIELRAVPQIDTPLGPITYPGSILIARKTVGGTVR